MTKLIKKSTSYSVKNVGSTLTATGNCNVNKNNFIESLYMNFVEGTKSIGNANYREDEKGSNYNYSLMDDKYKKEVNKLLDMIIADMKTHISK